MAKTDTKRRELTPEEIEEFDREEKRALEAQRIQRFRMKQIQTEGPEGFVKRHGVDSVNVGGWLYFADGARCDRQVFMRYEPPDDRVQRLKACRVWLVEKTQRARDAFLNYKQSLLDADSLAQRYGTLSVSGISPDAPAQLRHLKAIFKDLEARLAEVDRQLGPTPEELQQRVEARHRNHRAANHLTNIIKGIRLRD